MSYLFKLRQLVENIPLLETVNSYHINVAVYQVKLTKDSQISKRGSGPKTFYVIIG